MNDFLLHKLPALLLLLFFGLYFWYFSIFSILRMQSLHSHYFDLGIMNQAAYNSYMAVKEADFSRFLEITDPHESLMQVKRMAIHNDIILGLLGALYFIYNGPETLLVVQALVVAVGGIYVYLITRFLIKSEYSKYIALAISVSYFLYSPLQLALNFDFHAVTMAVTFILGYFFYFLKKNYKMQFLFAFLTLITKEQIGLVIFGISILQVCTVFLSNKKNNFLRKREFIFPITTGICSLLWVIVSIAVIIPFFRGEKHFGSDYFEHILENPFSVYKYVFNSEVYFYMGQLLLPVGFLSLLAPFYLLIGSSEFGINILSSNSNMRNIFFHYDTGIAAVVFIATVYGAKTLIFILNKLKHSKNLVFLNPEKTTIFYIIATSLVSYYFMSPLPFAKNADLYPFKTNNPNIDIIKDWKNYFTDNVYIASSARLAPFFSSRRYYYDLAGGYSKADYVIIYVPELRNSFQNKENNFQYKRLVTDPGYMLYDKKLDIEVYKKL